MSCVARVMCPICKQGIQQDTAHAVALPHLDRVGHVCPMSGEPVSDTE